MDLRLRDEGHVDWLLLAAVSVLLVFGVVSIWSATGDQTFVFSNLGVRQAAYSLLGFILMFVISRIDYRLIQYAAWPFYWFSNFLLVLVLFVGVVIGGSQRWIMLPGSITIQPSEIGKLATMIALGVFIAQRGSQMQKFSNFVVSLVIVAVPAGLDAQGLPLGLQLIGRPWEEGDLLNVAASLESAAGFVAKPTRWW